MSSDLDFSNAGQPVEKVCQRKDFLHSKGIIEQGEENGKQEKTERGVVELVDTENLVPQGHLPRKVDRAVDLRKIYKIVEPIHSEEDRQPSAEHRQALHTAGFWGTW